jgi:hypothetical protein
MKRRRWAPTVKPVVRNGSKNIASDYMVNQARGFIAWGLRRMLAEPNREFVHVSCIEGRWHANGHPDGPTTPCACCGDPVAVPCAICANAWKRGLASLVQSGVVLVDGDELRPGDLEVLLAVPDPVWRSA